MEIIKEDKILQTIHLKWNGRFCVCFRDQSHPVHTVENVLQKVALNDISTPDVTKDFSEEDYDEESDFSDFYDDDDAYIDSYDDWNESVASHGMTGEQTSAAHPNKQVCS